MVVDEAYIEFAAVESAVGLLESFDNLVVLRTLSKALAFAGARCGSVIATRGVIDMLNAVQAPYALATPVIECVESALAGDALAEAGRRVAETIAERQRLTDALTRYAFVDRVWPSAANFLLARVTDANTVMEHCAKDGLLLRYFGGRLADCVRITVGTADENDRLLQSLTRLGAANG